jgi:hypothetical protein
MELIDSKVNIATSILQYIVYAKHLRSSLLGFLKEDFLSFFFTHLFKNNDTPGAGPVLTPGLLFEQSLYTLTRRSFMLNI